MAFIGELGAIRGEKELRGPNPWEVVLWFADASDKVTV